MPWGWTEDVTHAPLTMAKSVGDYNYQHYKNTYRLCRQRLQHTHPFLNCKFAIHIYILQQGGISVLTNFMEGELTNFLFELCFFFLWTETNLTTYLCDFIFKQHKRRALFTSSIHVQPFHFWKTSKHLCPIYITQPFFVEVKHIIEQKLEAGSQTVLEV